MSLSKKLGVLAVLVSGAVLLYPKPALADPCYDEIMYASMHCEDYSDGCEYQVHAYCNVLQCTYTGGAGGWCYVGSPDNGQTYCVTEAGCYGWASSCDCGS
jgi:hypothetical protein